MNFEIKRGIYELSLREYYELFRKPVAMTTWENNLLQKITLRIGLGPVIERPSQPEILDGVNLGIRTMDEHNRPTRTTMWAGEVVIEIAPGTSVDLPSEWDRAIHRIEGNTVIGGLAPNLTRKDQTYLVDAALRSDAMVHATRRAQRRMGP